MTPTTSEREARVIDLLHRIERRATNHPDDTDDDLVRDMRHIVAHAREAIAALTREQREGDDSELPGMWSHADFTGGDPDERSYADRNKPQQEAPGAVAWKVHRGAFIRGYYDDFDSACAIAIEGDAITPLYTTPPAPVDVRKLQRWSVDFRSYSEDRVSEADDGDYVLFADIQALLDGQPAGVDRG